MKFEVYDDFISPTYQNILESLLSDYNTKWSYQPHSYVELAFHNF